MNCNLYVKGKNDSEGAAKQNRLTSKRLPHLPLFRTHQKGLLVMIPIKKHPGLVDALYSVGKQRQQILSNLRHAYQKKKLDDVLKYVAELIGVDEKLEAPLEKSH